MYRINELIKLDRKLYHTNDLAILWKTGNKNTLYTTIKRYVKNGVLIRIYKGLYSTVPLSELDPLELGKAVIHRYTYLSTESVLVQAGVITQATYAYTFVSDISKQVTVDSVSFLYRQLKPEYLNNPTGIASQKGVFVATPERAAADMLYFNPRYHFDVPSSLDMDKVKAIQQKIGYPC
jgi:predicted transcriptional regulator of viral defense system